MEPPEPAEPAERPAPPEPKKSLSGAGGTPGGIGSFLIGFLMMCMGTYWILNSIVVTDTFSLGRYLFRPNVFGSPFSITGGMILIPLMFGIGIIFYNARNLLGWALAVGSLAALLFGVLANLRFTFQSMSLFDLLVTLVLAFGGMGLFLRSLRDSSPKS